MISRSLMANARGRSTNPEWPPGNSASGLRSSVASAWAQLSLVLQRARQRGETGTAGNRSPLESPALTS